MERNPNLYDGEIYPTPIRAALFLGLIEVEDIDNTGQTNQEFAHNMNEWFAEADQFNFEVLL